MAQLLVLARGAVVVSTHAVAVGGTETASDPFAFDGSAELGNKVWHRLRKKQRPEQSFWR